MRQTNNTKFDLVIKGGTIVDGSGAESFVADLGIKGDVIVEIAPVIDAGDECEILNAKGKIVAPGFIDMHTHVDVELNNSNLISDPQAKNLLMQGVTTAIGGNCGIAVCSGKDFLGQVKPVLNVGLLVGHGVIRESVMGMANRPPSDEELLKMKGLLKEGLDCGAFGLSSGLGYSPGSYSELDEMVSLCKDVAEVDGIYTAHIREQSYKIEESWAEIIETGKKSQARVHVSHVQVIGKENWGKSKKLVQMMQDARKQGVSISCDGYPYESGGTTVVGALIPNWVQAEGKMAERLVDPTLLPKIKEEIAELVHLRCGAESVLITSCPSNLSVESKKLSEIADNWSITPVEAVIKLAIESSECDAIYFHSTEEDKQTFFKDSMCAVGSDSFCVMHDRKSKRLVHPRCYGTMPRFIAEYLRDKKVLSLEEGIRRMTSLPAMLLNIQNRGTLKTQNKADIVVFDYESIGDNASYTDSHHYPSGIETVIVNGTTVVDGLTSKNVTAGEVLYRETPTI